MIDKLIEKWEEKHSELLEDYQESTIQSLKNPLFVQLARSEMKNVLEFVEDLKQINLSLGGVSGSLVDEIRERRRTHMIALKKFEYSGEEGVNLRARISECQQIIGMINDR